MKRVILILLVLCLCLGFCGCGSTGAEDTESKTLPTYISQENWDSNRQYIELSTGLKMCYVEMGDPDGEPVILQHGMTDNTRSWSLAAPYFAEAGYHVYITDLRGHGKSSQPDGYYTVITYATDIKAFMDEKRIDKAIMVGHSLGSFTMQAFYLMFPEKCEKVVLEATAPLTSDLNAAFSRFFGVIDAAIESEGLEGHMSDEFIENWYANENPVPEDFVEWMKKESQALPLRVWKNVIGGVSTSNFEVLYERADKSVPVLIISGCKDTLLENQGPLLQEKLDSENCDYMEYENNGHNIHFEIPEKFASDVIDWLNK